MSPHMINPLPHDNTPQVVKAISGELLLRELSDECGITLPAASCDWK